MREPPDFFHLKRRRSTARHSPPPFLVFPKFKHTQSGKTSFLITTTQAHDRFPLLAPLSSRPAHFFFAPLHLLLPGFIMSFLLPFRPSLQCEAPQDGQQPRDQKTIEGSNGKVYVIPHLPGEGRFNVSAKVCTPSHPGYMRPRSSSQLMPVPHLVLRRSSLAPMQTQPSSNTSRPSAAK